MLYHSPSSNTYHTKPDHVRARKQARTRIYTVLYGPQSSQQTNLPWHDNSRRLPEGWSVDDAWHTIRSNWPTAKFDDFRKHLLLSRIHTLINGTIRLQDLEGQQS